MRALGFLLMCWSLLRSRLNCGDSTREGKMSIGTNIRRIREEKGISQVSLAEQAGISQAMLCQIERGTKKPIVTDRCGTCPLAGLSSRNTVTVALRLPRQS